MPKLDKSTTRSEALTVPSSRTALLRNLSAARAGTVILTTASGMSRQAAAEAVAREMGRPLVSLELGKLASQYIGETEKNLDRALAAAEAGGAVLFFDEADALFGTRSEVKDSHDRYANIETNYLLQKLEAYGGVVLLASSGRQCLDPACLSRLRNVVDLAWPAKGR
ncbi:ATP-binding protein [Roseateles paludis]|jgi:SpoVK/Ycf46/Vps4 family AAA+-type ATPase|uniref:ATP-binding protein n=1 Tax=Roseateles paludis TaxID=3145238 RepID=A0ABV0G2Q1_9BURK